MAKADSDFINAAAQRANMPVGAWLVETARLRVTGERIGRLAAQDPRPGLSFDELLALVRELPALSQARSCGRLALALRRLAAAEVAARTPAPLLDGGAARSQAEGNAREPLRVPAPASR